MPRQIKHRNVNSIWLYDFTQFEEFSQDRDRVLFLSMMDMNLIWNAIQNINLLQTRVYTEAEDQLYTMVDDTQFETFQGWVSDLRNHLGEYLVTNELLAQIVEQLEAIANKACCPSAGTGQGSRGTGGTQVPVNPYDEVEAAGEPPPGFEDVPAWKSNQCNAAQDLINNLGSDLQGLSGVTYSASSPTGIAGALVLFLLTPIPFDDLIALAGYLIFTGYNYALLSEMSALIAENNEDLLCVLYNAGSAADAQADFFDALQELAEANFTLPEDAQWVMGAIDWFITNDAFNKLFEPSVTISQDADCSMCGGIQLGEITSEFCPATLDSGEFLDGEETTITSCLSGGNIEGAIRQQVAFQSTDYPTNRRVEIISISSGDYLLHSNDETTPISFETFANAAAIEAYDEERSAVQISRWTVDVTTVPFTVTLKLYALP